MNPRISMLTPGVDGLEKSLRFCHEGPGLHTRGITGTGFEYGAVAMGSGLEPAGKGGKLKGVC